MHVGDLDVLDRFLLVGFLVWRSRIVSFGRRSSAVIEQLRAVLLAAAIGHRLKILQCRVCLLIICTIRRPSKVSYINQVLTIVQVFVNGRQTHDRVIFLQRRIRCHDSLVSCSFRLFPVLLQGLCQH